MNFRLYEAHDNIDNVINMPLVLGIPPGSQQEEITIPVVPSTHDDTTNLPNAYFVRRDAIICNAMKRLEGGGRLVYSLLSRLLYVLPPIFNTSIFINYMAGTPHTVVRPPNVRTRIPVSIGSVPDGMPVVMLTSALRTQTLNEWVLFATRGGMVSAIARTRGDGHSPAVYLPEMQCVYDNAEYCTEVAKALVYARNGYLFERDRDEQNIRCLPIQAGPVAGVTKEQLLQERDNGCHSVALGFALYLNDVRNSLRLIFNNIVANGCESGIAEAVSRDILRLKDETWVHDITVSGDNFSIATKEITTVGGENVGAVSITFFNNTFYVRSLRPDRKVPGMRNMATTFAQRNLDGSVNTSHTHALTLWFGERIVDITKLVGRLRFYDAATMIYRHIRASAGTGGHAV